MRRPLPLDDEVTEQLLAGRPHGDLEDLADLAVLIEEVRSLTRGPVPPPSSALAEILAKGARAGRPPAQEPISSPPSTRHRRRGAVWASLTGVAAAVILAVAASLEVLPRPAQQMVATAVSTVTPFKLPVDTPHGTGPGKKARAEARRPLATTAPPLASGRSEVRPPAPAREGGPTADGIAPPQAGTSGLIENSQRPASTTTLYSAPASSSAGPSAPVTSVPVATAPAVNAPVTTNPPPPGASVSSVDRWSATLTGAAVRPGPGDPDGAGSASLELNAGSGQLCLTLTLSAVGRPTDVGLHQAPHGQTGPVVAVLPPADARPRAPVCIPVTSDLLRQLRDDPTGYYLQVHTREFADGALRGQLSS